MYKIADLLLDREKLLIQIKKLKWLIFVLVALLISSLTNLTRKSKSDYVAHIEIFGVIDHHPELIEELKAVEEEKNAKALVISIDSPGGTTYGGEELYEAIKKISKKKPVIAVLGTVAASGGYMVALACDYIIARNMTITGSIGVISENYEVTELAQKLGIKLESYKSSPLKAAPNPFEKTSEAIKNAEMQIINDSYQLFVDMLVQGRKLKRDEALKLADGRIFIGKKAKELKLIDAIGGVDEALTWLGKEKKIDKNLPFILLDWNKPIGLLEEIRQHFHESKLFSSSISFKALLK